MKTSRVIGAGQMGGRIAQVAAYPGYSVILNDIKEDPTALFRSYKIRK